MKKPIGVISLFTFLLFTISSCQKAGMNGGTTLVVFAKHHGNVIPNKIGYQDSVYIKFNTEELPTDPTHNYDVVIVGDIGEDHVHCPGLHTGKYFIFVTGWDTTINARVMGGMAIKIKYKQRNDEIDQDVAVVE